MKWKELHILIITMLILSMPFSKSIPSEIQDTKFLSEEWLSAVAANNIKKTISIATKLIPKSDNKIPEAHIKLAENEGIKRVFLTAPFNYWDFDLWRSAYFWQQLSKNTSNIKDMFGLVHIKIESVEKKVGAFDRAPWPYWIWKREFGVCDRQAWVMSELAYQKGWETQIVYLMDPQTKTSPHTYCELRKGNKVWFADPMLNMLLPKSTEEIVNNERVLKTLWLDHSQSANLQKSLPHSIFWTPSYPQDYCPRNQELYRVLEKDLKGRCPRFGVPPEERLSRYRELGQKTIFDQSRFQMKLWFYPFRLLREDIIRYHNQFGVRFLR